MLVIVLKLLKILYFGKLKTSLILREEEKNESVYEFSVVFKQEKRAYITGIILLFGVALLELVAPKVIGIVVDEINDGTLTTDKLLKWVVLLVIVGITMYILRYIWRIMIFGSSLKLARQLRKIYMNILQR